MRPHPSAALPFVAASLSLFVAACGSPPPPDAASSVRGTRPPPSPAPSPEAVARDLMERGLDARAAGYHARAREAFLGARAALAPNGDALFEASREAAKLGADAEAKELLARAIDELTRAAGARFTVRPPKGNSFGIWKAEAAFPLDLHRFAVDADDYLIVDPRTERFLSIHLEGPNGTALFALGESARRASTVVSADKRLVGVVGNLLERIPGWNLPHDLHGESATIIDVLTGETIGVVPGVSPESSDGRTPSIAFSRSGEFAFVLGVSQDGPFAVQVLSRARRTARALASPAGITPIPRSRYDNPKGAVVLSNDEKVVAGRHGGRIVVWDVASGSVRASLDSGYDTPLALSADGRWLAFSGEGGIAKAVETTNGAELSLATTNCAATSVLIDPRGLYAAAGTADPQRACVSIWNLAERRVERDFEIEPPGALLSFAPDGRSLRFVHAIEAKKDPAWALAHPDELDDSVDAYDVGTGTKIAGSATALGKLDTASGPRSYRRNIAANTIDVDDGSGGKRCTIPAPLGVGKPDIVWLAPGFVSISPDGRVVVVRGHSGREEVSFYDADTCELRWKRRAHLNRSRVERIRFLGDANLVIDRIMSQVTWNLARGEVAPNALPPYWLAPTQTGFAVVAADRSKRALSPPADKRADRYKVSYDGKRVAIREPAAVGLWDLEKNTLVRRFAMKDARDASLRGQRLYAATETDVVVWDVPSGREILHLRGKTEFLRDPSWSPDGRLLVVAVDGRYRIHDLDRGAALGTFDIARTKQIEVRSDGKYIAVQYTNGETVVAETATGTIKRRLAAPGGYRGGLMEVAPIALHDSAPLLARADNSGLVYLYRFDGEKDPIALAVEESDRAAVAYAEGGLELAGDESVARLIPRCMLGARSYPFDLCRAEVTRPGLLATALAPAP